MDESATEAERDDGTSDDARRAALLLTEAHLAFERAEDRLKRIEAKGSWMLAGLIPVLGIVLVGAARQTRDTDFDAPLDVLLLVVAGGVIALLVGALYRTLRVINLVDFDLIAGSWLQGQVHSAEQGEGADPDPLALGIAHATFDCAASSTKQANAKASEFRTAMKLLQYAFWAIVPYSLILVADAARSAG